MIERCDTCYFYVDGVQERKECHRYPMQVLFMGNTPVPTGQVIHKQQRMALQAQIGQFAPTPPPDYGCGEWKPREGQFL